MALGIVEAVEELHGVDLLAIEHNSVQYLHILIEALRFAFADSRLPHPSSRSSALTLPHSEILRLRP